MGREKLWMTTEERDRFLDEEQTLRMAVVDDDGFPHVTPVWFVWDGGDFYVYNLNRARRTRLLEAGTRVGVVVDAGTDYAELRGVSATIARYAFLADDEVDDPLRRAFGRKNFGADHPVGGLDDHTWLRLEPASISTWDFRKVHTLRSS